MRARKWIRFLYNLIKMKKYLIIGQGSQTIQFIRELYSIGMTPNQLRIITLKGDANNSFLEFIEYYEINYITCINKDFDFKIDKILKEDNFNMVISFSNPFIIKSRHLNKSVFINFHPGKLPNYRGSFSTVHSMIHREKEVGGTWHYIDEKVDMGNIIKSVYLPNRKNSTAFSLNHQIFNKGIKVFCDVLDFVENKNKGIKQRKSEGKFFKNKFPDLSIITDEELKYRINFFPPKFN